MKMILLAIDDESNESILIEKGIILANLLDSKLYVFGVFKEGERLAEELKGIITKDEFRQKFLEYHENRIHGLVNQFNEFDIEVSIEVTIGMPFFEIIRKGFALDTELIIQSSHPETSKESNFSSADWHLMRKSPIPVWIVKPDSPKIPQKITVAVDASQNGEYESFNRNLLRLASILAKNLDAELSVLSAWRLVNEAYLRDSVFISATEAQITELRDQDKNEVIETHAALKSWVDDEAEIQTEQMHWHVIEGKPVDVITSFCESNNTNLLIMGTVNRTGIPGFLIGNTAEATLHKINCSVLTMKPKQFISPIDM